jgi:hypothetical protein
VDIPFVKVKRALEHHTIEGSPFTTSIPKKLDINPTPSRVIFEQQVPIIPPAPEPKVNSTSIPSNAHAVKSEEYSVMVLSSASDDHNTGNHQENALRTALLCGEEGCLKRAAISPSIKWVSCDHLDLPPIVDLLR